MADGHAGPVSYRPGSGTALVSGSCLVLLGPEVSRATATELWPVLDRATSLEELVEVVLEIGLRKLPTIAIAYRTTGETHVLLRGRALGAAGGVDGVPEQVLDSDARTWKEHAVRGPVRMYLDEDAGGEYLPLSSGVVPADALAIDWSGPGVGPAPDRPVPQAVPAAPALSDSESAPSVGVPEPGAPGQEDAGPSPAVADLVPPVDTSELTLTEIAFEELSSRSEPSVALGRPAAPPLSPTPVVPDEDDFDDLFGATRLPLPVEHAAVRDDGPEPEKIAPPSLDPSDSDTDPDDHPVVAGEGPPPAAGLGTGGFLPPSVRGPAVSAVQPPPADGARLIDGVPGVTPGSASRLPAEAPPPVRESGGLPATGSPTTGQMRPAPASTIDADLGDDGTSMTVSRSALGKMRNPTASPPPAATGQTVHGVLCDAGHPNPPAATVCRACSLPLELIDAVSMPRPVLGVLRFSNGIEVELDRPVIVGRAPKAERVSVREIPQLVTLRSPDKDISRNHMEVKLDGWHVIVVDLGSTNGTAVTLPGQPPERLRAQEEQPISPGTVVTIAEEVTFVYEVAT